MPDKQKSLFPANWLKCPRCGHRDKYFQKAICAYRCRWCGALYKANWDFQEVYLVTKNGVAKSGEGQEH